MKENNKEIKKDSKADSGIAILHKKRLGSTVGIVALFTLIIAVVIYVLTPYKAAGAAKALMDGEISTTVSDCLGETKLQAVEVSVIDKKMIVLQPEEAVAGMIFYPGGRVSYDAYVPLMYRLAEHGFICIIVKMPLNFAVLDTAAADGIKDMYPDIERWFIGGHSLGGAMAASYVSEHSEEYEGLMLLGAYSVDNLTDTGLKVFLAYGTQDGVINRDVYGRNLKNLPKGSREYLIVGGCHAYFGDYGRQAGDGHPYITREEQMDNTIEEFISYVNTVRDEDDFTEE